MPTLENPQEERFAQLLAVGVSQAAAYSKAGWVKDKANSSKRAKLPHIIARVGELRAEEAERQASIRLQAAELPGIDELKRALQGAAAAGQWSAVVSAAKALAEGDGSLDPDPAEADAAEERKRILAELYALFPESAHPSLAEYLKQPAVRPSAVRAAKRQSGGR
jgi:hypothetical protein